VAVDDVSVFEAAPLVGYCYLVDIIIDAVSRLLMRLWSNDRPLATKFCIEFQKAVVNVLAIAVMSRSKVPTLLK
jgi:hypothetical protein